MPRSEDTVPTNLALITSIANQLLEATASTATQASEQVLAQLVDHFDLHYAFLRYSDHNIRASVLVAEWPRALRRRQPRPVRVSSPSPATTRRLALCENGKDLVMVNRHLPERRVFRCPVDRRHRRGGRPMVVAAPLISGTMTTGVLGSSSVAAVGGRRRRRTPSRRSRRCSRSSRPASRPKSGFATSPIMTT